MLGELDGASRVGFADQIVVAVHRAVVAGELAPGELLPTSKVLGQALGVNPNTVLAAYRILRDERVLEFRRGRGVRVAGDAAALEARILDAAREFIRVGADLGYTVNQLPEVLQRAVETT